MTQKRAALPIWYVHGAGASTRSFAWLRTQLPAHPSHLFSYDLAAGLVPGIAGLRRAMDGHKPGIVIGHSLGGLIAAGVAEDRQCLGVVTLSAPFGGLSIAMLLGLLYHDQVLRDLSPFNPLLRSIRSGVLAAGKPHLPIIATGGLAFLPGGANDGVVSVESQTAIEGITYLPLAVNHFETLLSDEAAGFITEFVQQVTSKQPTGVG